MRWATTSLWSCPVKLVYMLKLTLKYIFEYLCDLGRLCVVFVPLSLRHLKQKLDNVLHALFLSASFHASVLVWNCLPQCSGNPFWNSCILWGWHERLALGLFLHFSLQFG